MKRAGFSIIDALIIALIVVIVALVGIAVVHRVIASKPVTTPDAKTAQNLTQEFYAKYLNSGGTDLIGQYGTANLAAQSKTGSSGYSPIICSQYPASVSTGAPTYSDGRYRVPVTLALKPAVSFTAEVIKVGDAFKIDKIDCPPRPDLG